MLHEQCFEFIAFTSENDIACSFSLSAWTDDMIDLANAADALQATDNDRTPKLVRAHGNQ